MTDCLFCGIAAHEIPADIVLDDEDVLAFRDINPQAPTHILVIPRQHIESAAELREPHDQLWVKLLRATQELARRDCIDESGFRIVVNTGHDGGQTVGHLHLHLLGGRRMTWPPG
jgi:histidine triad (HIT) family protein